MDLLQARQELQPYHGDGLVGELELAHHEELFQVGAKQLHDHRLGPDSIEKKLGLSFCSIHALRLCIHWGLLTASQPCRGWRVFFVL